MICQCDFKIEIPAFLLTQILPKSAKKYHESLVKHYVKSHKRMWYVFFNIIINSVEFKLKIILIKYDIFLLNVIKSFT